MTVFSYSDAFWAPELNSTAGYDALVKRNHESKKICAELEDYLKKRSKVEADYSKSLSDLVKCFKPREEIGVLEATLNKLKAELETIANVHTTAAMFFQQQAETIKKFKLEQMNARKALEESLNKTQNSKLSQLNKTMQMEKTYVRKCIEKDNAELSLKETLSTPQANPKDVEKARNKLTRATDDSEKADAAYKGAVMLLEDYRIKWEAEMTNTCQSIQSLDQERIKFLRQELWTAVNTHSQIALDIDNSCESVREILEKCDISADLDAFVQFAGVGEIHPEPFSYRHYTQVIASDNDSNSSNSLPNEYATICDVEANEDNNQTTTLADRELSQTPQSNNGKKGMLTLPKMFGKKKSSSTS